MKILVTGSEGYIEVRLFKRLKQANFEVTGLDSGFYRRGWLYGSSIEETQKIKFLHIKKQS